MKTPKILILLLVNLISFTNLTGLFAQNHTLDLSGQWQFAIDRVDAGITEKWFNKPLSDNIYLPGSMAENRKGDDVTLRTQWTGSLYDSTFFFNPRMKKFRVQENLKLPFWLMPVKYYVGAAWYQKTVEIPKEWKSQRVVLFLERPHITSMVWINGHLIENEKTQNNSQFSLSVPHVFDVSKFLKTGKNTITIRIDNRIPDNSPINIGKNSHSVTDQTQGNWNGIIGKIELRSQPTTYISDVQIFPDVKNKTVKVKIKIIGSAGSIILDAESFNSEKNQKIHFDATNKYAKESDGYISVNLSMGDDCLLWDEFHPNLYKLKVTVDTYTKRNIYETQFGMREFTVDGKWFYVNGRKTMLRGTVECCLFPLTGYAPMDVESWLRVFKICKNFGLNHMRFHSYCPPEAALQAADLVGFYLQVEGPTWPNYTTSLGDGRPSDDYLWNEAQSIVKQYGNYASFCMFAIGNEPRGRWVAWVSKFVDYWKATDSRRVYTGASVGQGWAWQPRNQYHVKAGARGLDWGKMPETVSDYRARIDTVSVPYVSHETGQWCVFPDFTEIPKYTGVMRARNFELFREDLQDRGMGDLSHNFLMASGRLQALCYKHEIEKTLRTPDYAGFQLLSLNDYSGQGTALVGVLNVFFEEKGYINAEEFRRFCAPTVLLARMEKFVYSNKDTLKADIEVAHFGEYILKNQVITWRIKDEFGKILTETRGFKDIEIGNCQNIGKIKQSLAVIAGLTRNPLKAQKLTLELAFADKNISNSWNFWVYPATLEPVIAANAAIPTNQQEIAGQARNDGGVFITDKIDAQTKTILENGGKVLLLLNGKITQGKDVVQYYTPSFWNTSWFKMRPPHTEGSFIRNFHPIFADFPTENWTDLQWWELTNRAQVMELTDFPADFQPIVQPIDTWFINRKLGSLFEAKIGKGKIVVCSFDLQNDLDNRLVARQLRYSILKYMNSNKFFPEKTVDLQLIDNLTKKAGETVIFTTKDMPDELKGTTL